MTGWNVNYSITWEHNVPKKPVLLQDLILLLRHLGQIEFFSTVGMLKKVGMGLKSEESYNL